MMDFGSLPSSHSFLSFVVWMLFCCLCDVVCMLFVCCLYVVCMLFVCCLYVVCIVVMYHCLHDVVVAKVIIV